MSITPENKRDLIQGLLHLWSKFGDPSLNGWWVIARTNLVTDGRTDWRTDAGNDNTRRPKLALGKKDLEDEVKELNIFIEGKALENNLTSVKLGQAIICSSKNKRGRPKKNSYTRVISYTHLYDGIHGDEKLKKICCDKILKAAKSAYNNIALAASQGSSQEEDCDDFKRRKH